MSEQQTIQTHAVILSTGDELVMGQLQDSNARWLAERLTDSGVRVVACCMVGDDLDALAGEIERLSRLAPLVVMSGGLGPTDGDLTRQALCKATGDTLLPDEQAESDLRSRLLARGREMTERQRRQAFRPTRARCLRNDHGTAPGLHLRVGGADLFALPGPPGELRPMWHGQVVPALRPHPSRAVATRLLYVVGLPEADLADKLKNLTARGGPVTVNLTASGGVITVRARAEGKQTDALGTTFDATLDTVRSVLGSCCVAERASGDTTGTHALCAANLERLTTLHHTLATVESCTGGMLGEWLSAVPGSSSAYLGGLVTYANDLKARLADVPVEVINAHGAVSREVAVVMAERGRHRTGSTHALAITGIAGPTGGTADKPVGTVWIALASDSHPADVRGFHFPGDRQDVRTRACTAALSMLHFRLVGGGPARMLWQRV